MRILCAGAHPDDETMFAGGTIRLLSSRGTDVHLLCATRGEGGELGEPPLCTRAELGAIREAEMRCAAQALGCASLAFLPFADPPVGTDGGLYPYAETTEEVSSPLVKILEPLQPDLIITHGTDGEYGHPGHILTNRACVLAARTAGIPAVLTFSAFHAGHPRPRNANRNDPADFVVDITPVLEQKLAAVACYRTQHALILRRPSAEAGRPVTLRETLVDRESFRLVRTGRRAEEAGRRFGSLLQDAMR